ncbi:CMGC DYRK PRP4 kinase [Babesia ovis]|uniref:non-specific serine/threonine protein kinase n=1 Tax=Babesia ovis TaxID=5869 RepID=A0A9W5WU68_BABOV|nr:CMGC DYRK PRP4 kinase [Babesia ovis]
MAGHRSHRDISHDRDSSRSRHRSKRHLRRDSSSESRSTGEDLSHSPSESRSRRYRTSRSGSSHQRRGSHRTDRYSDIHSKRSRAHRSPDRSRSRSILKFGNNSNQISAGPVDIPRGPDSSDYRQSDRTILVGAKRRNNQEPFTKPRSFIHDESDGASEEGEIVEDIILEDDEVDVDAFLEQRRRERQKLMAKFSLAARQSSGSCDTSLNSTPRDPNPSEDALSPKAVVDTAVSDGTPLEDTLTRDTTSKNTLTLDTPSNNNTTQQGAEGNTAGSLEGSLDSPDNPSDHHTTTDGGYHLSTSHCPPQRSRNPFSMFISKLDTESNHGVNSVGPGNITLEDTSSDNITFKDTSSDNITLKDTSSDNVKFKDTSPIKITVSKSSDKGNPTLDPAGETPKPSVPIFAMSCENLDDTQMSSLAASDIDDDDLSYPTVPDSSKSTIMNALQSEILTEKIKLRNMMLKLREEYKSGLDDANGDPVQEAGGMCQDAEPYYSSDSDDEVDMFAEADDAAAKKARSPSRRKKAPRREPTVRGLSDEWNDAEGYYQATIGELLGGRYRVVAESAGKGVFSSVARCVDTESNAPVAIKVIRNHEIMVRAAEKEIGILRRLNDSDPDDRRHVVRLLDRFDYRGHLCIVFPWYWGNLRSALRLHGKGKGGFSLPYIHSYTRQLFIALRHLSRNGIMHADLKPDNILVNDDFSKITVCDLGSASDVTENEITAYLVSRFYRAPEIILGLRYDCKIDVWSAAATIYELATGDILFPGRTNNHMLKLMMDIKGKVPNRVIRAGQLSSQHFDDNLDFIYLSRDSFSRKDTAKIVRDFSVKRGITDALLDRQPWIKGNSPKKDAMVRKLRQLGDLLERCLAIDPQKRLSADEALQHPFIRG